MDRWRPFWRPQWITLKLIVVGGSSFESHWRLFVGRHQLHALLRLKGKALEVFFVARTSIERNVNFFVRRWLFNGFTLHLWRRHELWLIGRNTFKFDRGPRILRLALNLRTLHWFVGWVSLIREGFELLLVWWRAIEGHSVGYFVLSQN